MTADARERALGAGETIDVNGTTYTLLPVAARQLCALERESLAYYKGDVISTYSENLDLIPNGEAALAEKVAEVSLWDLSNLPQKNAYDVTSVPVGDQKCLDGTGEKLTFVPNESLAIWMKANYGEIPETAAVMRVLLVNALDTGRMSAAELEKMTGKKPIQGRIRYDQWWISGTVTGQLSFLRSSVTNGDGKKVGKDVLMEWPFPKIIEATQKVEKLTMAPAENS